jgi:hypothetical protein
MFTVMPTALSDFHGAINQTVDYSVFIVNLSRPPSGQIAAQRLGLAYAVITIAFNILHQPIYSPQSFLIMPLPVKIIVPRGLGP